ncbi:SDR family oxidoreductase [Thermoactinospora rubra]|uniref:SDR family oxidoreductase n=1 Tax=Thermoactinospora rubra TaxID=1088767 RepID=UPI000A0FA0EC|nr:SDR family oxidoreductase [Thermoactinospora rubra]
MTTLHGRRVLITGAASGIGRATALLAARAGAELYLTDRDAGGLASVASEAGALLAKTADVSDLAQVRGLAEEIHAVAGPMDVVMNIAGISTWGTVQNLRHDQWRAMVEVNLMGPIHVIECFVPAMIAAGRGGHLVNVSSAAGLVGLPWHAAYSAAKYGLRGVSEVLRFDLRRHGIRVTLVCPGAVDTPLTETVEIAGVDRYSPAFRRLQELFRKSAATPEEAARAILRGVARDRYLVHTSTRVRLLHWAERFCPPVYVVIMRAMNDLLTRALEPR